MVDVDTCEPVRDVLVDIWHCNATGSYSSFTELYAQQDEGSLLIFMRGCLIFLYVTFIIVRDRNGLTIWFLSTDNSTWLRGMWQSDKHGVTSFTTIFPGF